MRSVTQYTKSYFMYLVSGDAGHLTTNIWFRTVPEKRIAGRAKNKNKQRVERNNEWLLRDATPQIGYRT